MKVKVVKDFTHLENIWNIKYPELNEILDVESVKDYDGNANLTTLMLRFKKYNHLPWMCLSDHKGNANFDIIVDVKNLPHQYSKRVPKTEIGWILCNLNLHNWKYHHYRTCKRCGASQTLYGYGHIDRWEY